jgi:hypothetical protein
LIVRITATILSRFSNCDCQSSFSASCLTPYGSSMIKGPVDGQREPCHGAASRLSAASSKTLGPPLIRLYPPRRHALVRYMPNPQNIGWHMVYGVVFRMVYEGYLVLKTNIGRLEREFMALEADRKSFISSPYGTFPTFDDHTDRNYRLTLPIPLLLR